MDQHLFREVLGTVVCTTPYGVLPVGPVNGYGPVGNDNRGPILLFANGSGDGVIFNGESGSRYEGTGGGVYNLKIVKESGHFGGTGLLITGIDKANRFGEGEFKNVKVFQRGDLGSGASGEWTHGVVVDGTMYPDSGAAGIRRLLFENLRVSGVEEKAIWLRNATHVTMIHCEVDPGEAKESIIHIEGGQDISAYGLECNGTLLLDNVTDVMLSGPNMGNVVINGGRNITLTGNCLSLTVNKGAEGAFYGNCKKKPNVPLFGAFKVR